MTTYSELKIIVIESISTVIGTQIKDILLDKKLINDLGMGDVDYFETLLEIEDTLPEFFDNEEFDDMPDTVNDLCVNIAKSLKIVIE